MAQITFLNKYLALTLLVLVFVLQDGVLLAATIFPVYELVSQVSESLASNATYFVRHWYDFKVSADRIQVRPIS